MNFWSFLAKSLVLFFVCVLVIGAILTYWGDADANIAAGIGLLISFGNAISGFAFLKWGFNRSHKDFLLSVFGGIIFRFLLIFSLLFILIGALHVDRVALVFTLVATYFLFMGLEIFEIHKYSDPERK
jgi:hypothetical protein